MSMDYLNEEKRLAKLADKVAKKREQKPHSKRLAKKAEKVTILQEKQASRLNQIAELDARQAERVARQAERVARQAERVVQSDAIIAASKARVAENNAEIKAVWNETVAMMRDINHQHAQQRSDMLNNSLNRSRRNDSE